MGPSQTKGRGRKEGRNRAGVSVCDNQPDCSTRAYTKNRREWERESESGSYRVEQWAFISPPTSTKDVVVVLVVDVERKSLGRARLQQTLFFFFSFFFFWLTSSLLLVLLYINVPWLYTAPFFLLCGTLLVVFFFACLFDSSPFLEAKKRKKRRTTKPNPFQVFTQGGVYILPSPPPLFPRPPLPLSCSLPLLCKSSF